MRPWSDLAGWQPPADWLKITTLDMHTGGEPLRVTTGGLPPLRGRTVLEKRSFFREHYDHLRTGLMWEPRGHADMYGAVVTPSEEADYDVFFLHNEGYSTMCGHAIIALATLAHRAGLLHAAAGSEHIIFNVPAGRIEATARADDGEVRTASFRNVPSFVYLRDRIVDVPGIGRVGFDVAYGGAFYAFVEAEPLGLVLAPEGYDRLIDYGRRIKRAVMAAFPIEHPFETALSFLYGTIFTGRPHDPAHHSRNVCIFAEGEVDRSPTGSGVSARAALHHAKGELPLGETVTIESILGTTMTVQAAERTSFGPFEAVIPEVSGTAFITGRHEFWFDPADPLARGFIFR
jgi:trans-L-3-hydroxyproline dehydratase